MMDPRAIESRSMEIIASLLSGLEMGDAERRVVFRVVHATGDPSLVKLMRFHPDLPAAVMAAFRSGCAVVTDVEMVRAGISRPALKRLGCESFCGVHDPQAARMATELGITRSAAAMDLLAEAMDGGLVVVGNAPTALTRVLHLVETGRIRPAAVVGTPVGFVGARESKDALVASGIPFFTVLGERGGSPMAVAAVNALLKLAEEE